MSNAAVTVTVPGQPVSKQRPRFNTTTGRAATPQVTKAAEARVGWALREAFPTVNRRSEFKVSLWFYSKDRRRRDIDNLTKLCLDAANGIVWQDDSQVVELHAWHVRGCLEPLTRILVEVVA